MINRVSSLIPFLFRRLSPFATLLALLLFLLAPFLPSPLHASEVEAALGKPLHPALSPQVNDSYLTFYLDNDLFGGTDEGYTNGARLSWISRAHRLDELWGVYRFLDEFSEFSNVRGKTVPWIYNFGISLTQLMFTPTNIVTAAPIPSDRPYAGWLGLGFSLHAKNNVELHSIELSVGVVGDYSLAEQTQDFVHDARSIARANGWNNRLANEPTLNLHYRRTHRLSGASFFDGFLEFDHSYRWGFEAGNAWTNLQAGYYFRLGYNLPVDFSDPTLSNTAYTQQLFTDGVDLVNPWSVFIIAGAEGRAVGRNIFLDGNTFADGPSIAKRYFVGEATVGLGVQYRNWRATYAQTFRTKEFHQQIEGQEFGSISVSVAF